MIDPLIRSLIILAQIDPLTEDLITPAAATALYPRGPGGRKVHVSRVYRDMKIGVRGVRLESVKTPRLATSRQAVARFFARLSEGSRPAVALSRHPAQQRNSNAVEQELDRLGF